MRLKLHKIPMIFALLSLCYNANAQRDNISVFDTIMHNGEKVLLYENNTWEFIRSIEAIAHDKSIADTMSIFSDYWDNDQIFVYSFPESPFAGRIRVIVLTSH